MDGTLTREEADMVVAEAEKLPEIFPGVGIKIANLMPEIMVHMNKAQPKKAVEGTENEKGQLEADRILARLMQMRNDYFRGSIVMFTGKDLYLKNPPLTWCFGAANHGRGTTVQSVCRYRELTAEEEQACIGRTLRHELGHIFGLAKDPMRTNTIRKNGMHCLNPACGMRWSPNKKVLLERIEEERLAGRYFCEECMADLKKEYLKSRGRGF